MSPKIKLALWEITSVVWIAMAGSLLHFAFELSDYWTPMALLAAVNESAWEHVKMYFWPGLLFALVQYTYSRDYANNYWLGKALGLAVTPAVILGAYFGYMALTDSLGLKPSLPVMLALMMAGIGGGQAVSYAVLTRRPIVRLASIPTGKLAAGVYAALLMMFSAFTYMPPRNMIFENFFCYEYTGEYGILRDYDPYRVFTAVNPDGTRRSGGGMNYCEAKNVPSAMVRGEAETPQAGNRGL